MVKNSDLSERMPAVASQAATDVMCRRLFGANPPSQLKKAIHVQTDTALGRDT